MNPPEARIRVGVVLAALDVPAWQAAALEAIAGSDCAELALVVLQPGAAPARSRVHEAFLRIEDRNRRPQPDACAAVSIRPLVAGIGRIDTADGSWIPQVRSRELDVLVVLADSERLPAGVRLARWGHWRYAIDGHSFTPADGSMAGFDELIRRRAFLPTSLEAQQPGDPAVRTAYATRSAIDYHSHYVTRNEHLWKCSTFLLRALRKCREAGGEAYLQSLPRATAPVERSPTVWPAFLAYLLWRAWRKLRRRLFSDRWVLMVGVDEPRPQEGRFVILHPPSGRFWADPHVVESGGRHHVFFEDASRASGHGHIALMSDTGSGDFAPPVEILKKPYHLSYPFVFRWRDDWYLVPESAANRTVELYRCIRFPDEWAFEHNLLEGVEAYDSTLVEHDGRWWLFANLRAHPAASGWDELHVFHADSPVSRHWHAHRDNPVLSDVTCARPAGRFYSHHGRLRRPSQDSSRRYGHALRVNEVVELSDRRYAERTVEAVEPSWNRSVSGVHSYSRAGRITAIDAILRSPA